MDEENISEVSRNASNKSCKPIHSNWRPPRKYRWMSLKEADQLRAENKILAEGQDLMAPIKLFKDMRLPKAMLQILREKEINQATAIQMQCLPASLSGKDVIAIAPSGSGKSLIYLIQALVLAIEEEKTMSIIRGEGPFCLVILPSHELAIQTYENFVYFADKLNQQGYPPLKIMLCIGGVEMKVQLEAITEGLHIAVGTPGRLTDFLNKKKFNLELCELLVLDEADRLLDSAFETELVYLFSNLRARKQIIFLSSTFPKRIEDFAKLILTNPVAVSTNQRAETSFNVIQDVEYVAPDDKLKYLLETLKKTPPPVLIFCENKFDVDIVHEFLLTRGIDTAGVHGGKSQDERSEAITDFKKGKKDVLVATDVAAKGLNLPAIQHVINFTMCREINHYIIRVGRAGRTEKPGMVTTFVNKTNDPVSLIALKEILIQYGQSVPPFLQVLKDPDSEKTTCNYCGSDKHNINQCLKLERHKLRILAGLEFDEKAE